MPRPLPLLATAALAIVLALAVAVGRGGERSGFEARAEAPLAALGALVPFAYALHVLGGTLAGLALAGAAALLLVRARHRRLAAELFAGTLLTLLASGLLKVLVGRERPEDALLQLADGAYPSGHAARAAFFACFSIGLALRLRPRIVPVVATLAVSYALAMGASRLVLQVHRAYDVLGGWALGVGVWAAVGLLLSYARRTAPDAQAA